MLIIEIIEQAKLLEGIFEEIMELLLLLLYDTQQFAKNDIFLYIATFKNDIFLHIATFILDMKLIKPKPVYPDIATVILDMTLKKNILINCNFQKMPTIESYIIDMMLQKKILITHNFQKMPTIVSDIIAMQLKKKIIPVNTGYFNKLIESTQRILEMFARGFIYDSQKVMMWKLDDLQRRPFRPQIFACIKIEQADFFRFNVANFNLPHFNFPVPLLVFPPEPDLPRMPDQIHQVIFDARMHRGELDQLFNRVPPELLPAYQRALFEQLIFEKVANGHIFNFD